MKYKILFSIFLVIFILSACSSIDIDNNEKLTNEQRENNSNSTDQDDEVKSNEDVKNYLKNAQILKSYLPDMEKEMYYYGLAEYGHIATMSLVSEDLEKSEYKYLGTYNDGTGIEDDFEIRYIIDYKEGIVSEYVISNTRNDKKEVNSKLHDLILVKLPLELGNKWTQETIINDEKHTVNSEIIEYDKETGKVKVKYVAKGVSGYYNETYFEERSFEKGYGLTGFMNLFPGEHELSDDEKSDPQKTEEVLRNIFSFGYSLNKYN